MKTWFLIILIGACNNLQAQEFLLGVDSTMNHLLHQADTDGDKKITVEDSPKGAYWLVSKERDSVKLERIYYLSNLLQELALANLQNQDSLDVSLEKITEPPADRISRRIQELFWDDLTRTIDREGLARILQDSKASGDIQRLYVPAGDSTGIAYYKKLQENISGFEVVILPQQVSPEYVKSINDEPGLLALKIEDGRGVPFVVPGGRFNEMYGWDSYFEGIGLLLDGRTDLAKAMVDNFVYQITHYGKILNANRTYYLTRTQPPFLSSFVREVYARMKPKNSGWLRKSLNAAITEYQEVWMERGGRLTENGLNRYYAGGVGIPPETEKGHFGEVLKEYASRYGLSLNDFKQRYQSGQIKDPDLDAYFKHDRSIRESGHDTSWRLEGRAANLNTVDLNTLLYKYETDFAFLISTYFGGSFTASSGQTYTTRYWNEKADERKQRMNDLLWNEKEGSFFDYNFRKEEQTEYVSATNFYPLWAKMVSTDKAEKMVHNLLEDLKSRGGILASSKASVEETATGDVQRQWDYPYGWAPHQMLIWRGLLNYGYAEEAHELIYRWLWMITKNAVDYNGTIPEKFDVVDATHKVYAEYGNVGTEFDYITTSGFGWMNASYQLGLDLLPEIYVQKLNELVPPERLF